MTVGERVYNLERYFNNLCGFDGKDDTLPQRYLTEPGTGPAGESVVELDEMKAEYLRRPRLGRRCRSGSEAARAGRSSVEVEPGPVLEVGL